MVYDGLILADLHWGAIDPNEFFYELDWCLFNLIDNINRTNDKLDFIVFCGDFFDMKEYLSSKTVSMAITFLTDLILMTEDLGTEIYMIEGTRSHDSLQTLSLYHILAGVGNFNRFHVYDKVTSVKHGDMKFLMIPEEYIVDQDAYYKPYFKEKYDFIFGHGITDVIWYAKKDENLEINHVHSAPIFSVEELCSVGRYVYFGHVHERKKYGPNERFTSIGPTTRWEYDKPWPCGYYKVAYDPESGACQEVFIENTVAQKLGTVSTSINNDMVVQDVDRVVSGLIDRGLKKFDKLSVIINIDPNHPHLQAIRDILRAKVSVYKNIKLSFRMKETEEYVNTENVNKDKGQKEYLYSQGTPPEVKIQQFIVKNGGDKIDLDVIRETIGVDNDEEKGLSDPNGE